MKKLNDKFYMTFNELDEVETMYEKSTDILSLETKLTEEKLERFLQDVQSMPGNENHPEACIYFLFYLKTQIEQNAKMYKPYLKDVKTIEKVLNKHLEVMDIEEYRELFPEK